MFDGDSVYLPTKKIGKNNPKATEIKADNAARQVWNQTADRALVSGVPEEKVLKVKRENIQLAAQRSIKTQGWMPGFFRKIIHAAVEKLKGLIRENALPPKPMPKIDIDVYNKMVALYKAIQKENDLAGKLEQKIFRLEEKLTQSTGLFKSGERKQLRAEIDKTETSKKKHEKAIDTKVRKAGYPDVQTFLRTLEKSRPLAMQYQEEMKAWQEEVATIKASKHPSRKRQKPEKKSIREQLTRYQEEAKKQPPRSRRSQHLGR